MKDGTQHILFVDDDQMILDGLQRSLRAKRDEWRMTFVNSGRKAQAVMNDESVDVLVTDMRMPGMSGDELLAWVAAEHPSISRIVLSGHAAGQATSRAVALAHRYLAKPIETDALRTAVEECIILNRIISNQQVLDMVGGTSALPAMPDVYLQLCNAIDNDDADADEIARIIAQDVGICAKLLHVVNSSYYGLSRKVSGIERAIDLIGRRRLKSLVLSTSVVEVMEPSESIVGFCVRDLQADSLRAGQIAYRVLNEYRPDAEMAEQAYVGGLLHQMGRLLLSARRPDLLSRILLECEQRSEPPAPIETEVLGATQGCVGAFLLGLWTLPSPIVEAVGQYQAPTVQQGQRFDVRAAVHVGAGLAWAVRHNRLHDAETLLDTEYLSELGVGDRIPRWIEDVHHQEGERSASAA